MANIITLPAAITRDTLARLILTYVETGDLDRAARAAGLTLTRASECLRMPGARAMVARAMRQQLDCVAAPLALAVATGILRDPDAPLRVKADMAKTVLDRAGLIAQPQEAARERNLSELSAADLAALIDELQGELGERAAAPPAGDGEPDDFLA